MTRHPIAESPSPRPGAPAGLVAYRHVRPESAIDEYGRHLVDALNAAGVAAAYASDGLASARRPGPAPPWVILQYNPFSYGHWGVAPALVRDALALRRRWAGTRFAVMVHEAWVPMHDVRSTLMGGYQRLQLRALLKLADAVIVSREALVREIDPGAIHVPVASNILPLAVTPADARGRLGLGDRLVVGLLGTAGADRALDHAAAAVDALAAEGALTVLNLGRTAPSLAVGTQVDIRTPGRLSADALSLWLRACDLLLLPFTDGLSTRRTTLMAGLAHGVAVLGLAGANTDRVLRSHPAAIRLTPAGDPATFAAAAVALARDAGALAAAAEAGRRLYAAEFDWPVLARRMAAAVDGVSAGRGRDA